MKLNPISVESIYHDEPALQFAGGRLHLSPKLGVTIFGPRSLDQPDRHPNIINIGLIGSGQSIKAARKWIETCAAGVSGDKDHTDFPGFDADHGFYAELGISDSNNEVITTHDLRQIAAPRLRKERFRAAFELVDEKLRLLSERDRTPDCVVLALPDSMLEHCKTVDYTEPDLGIVHRDFRRAVKAASMNYHLPTQILLQRTSEASPDSRNVDHKSRCAWNFFTGIYYKAGGIPWAPSALTPGTCYVGVSFHRAMGTNQSRYFTSTAQAFDEHGDGLVLRGQDFVWDSTKEGRSPHLSEQLAGELIEATLERYRKELKQVPSRVVIHKSSQFWPEERQGFEKALRNVNQYDLLAISPVSYTRLLRDGNYPVLRGTHVRLGNQHLLYTTGYIPSLNAFPHGHVPSPLMVFQHEGDTDIDDLLNEVLVLTKMNWNTSSFAGLMPITLRFSKLVGEIMNEIPKEREPLPQFKYYM